MKRFDLQRVLVETALGVPLESLAPAPMAITQCADALWTLNARFRPYVARIGSLAYNPTQEAAADDAVERLVLQNDAWTNEAPDVWRVLLERHQQALMLLAIRAADAGTWDARLFSVPAPAGDALRAKLAIVFLLHSTSLPFAVVERTDAALPQGNFPGTLTRQ